MSPQPARWERLEELFAAAAELTGEEQAAFVERETAGDPELRRELQVLLEHDGAAGRRIAEAVHGAAVAAASPVEWTGRRFGPYLIRREIGRGGMGLVFEAVRDDDEYRKRVALKIAPWWRDLDLLRERFRAERQILAGLEHPNIARFLDGGTQDGVPYFAMEYVDGRPITEYAAALKLRERIELFQQVCAGVRFAHQNLVVHRDLKPSNMLVQCGADGRATVKLLDFGIAKLLGSAEENPATTLTGMAAWTPDYASPEQVRAGRITTRTDVYSLGLILFEILTGTRAQRADTSSPLAIDRSVCETDAPLASTRASRSVARQLAGDLDAIVAKAVEKDPERRYASVAELSEDLGRYLQGRPVVARKPSASYRARRYLRRNWLPVGAVSVAVLGLAAGAIGFAWQARVAERRFNEIRRLATVFLFDVHDKVQALPGATAVREMVTRTAVQSLDRLSRDAGRNYALRSELAAAWLRLGKVQGASVGASEGRGRDALASFERGLKLLEGMPESELRRAAVTEGGLRDERGQLLKSFGRVAEGDADLKRAAVVFRSICINPAKDAPACKSLLGAIMGLAETAIGYRQVDEAEAYLREFDGLTESLQGVLSSIVTPVHRLDGRILHARVEWIRKGDAEGDAALRPALPEAEQLVAQNPRDLDALRVGVNVIDFYGAMAIHVPADADLEAALRHGVEWAGRLTEFDPEDRRSKYQLASLRAYLGELLAHRDPSRAAVLLRGSLDEFMGELRLAPSNINLVAIAVRTADTLVDAEVAGGREGQAVDDLREVLELYDPLSMMGLKLARSETVRQIQAIAWVAQAEGKLRPSGSAWAREAARRAAAALEKEPADPALQAAVATLYDGLGLRGRAGELWHALAVRFPEAPGLRAAR